MTYTRHLLVITLLFLLSFPLHAQTPPPATQPSDPHAKSEWQKILAAYRDTRQYQSRVTTTLTLASRHETMVETTTYSIAFDRGRPALLADLPTETILSINNRLVVKSEFIKHLYVDAPLPTTLIQQDLVGATGNLFLRPSSAEPDLLLLLSPTPENPEKYFARYPFTPDDLTTVPPRPDDPRKCPGLRHHIPKSTFTFYYDPQTYLLVQTIRDARDFADETCVFVRTIDVISHNKPLLDKAFQLDTTGLRPVGSFKKWAGIQDDSNDQTAPKPNPKRQGGPPLQSSITRLDGTLTTFSPTQSKVVVLTFWATWCPPCVKSLPDFQALQIWATDQKLPVTLHAINIGEPIDHVKAFWTSKYTPLTPLLDLDGSVAQAYAVSALPVTLILREGKPFKLFPANNPKPTRDQLTQAIQEALK